MEKTDLKQTNNEVESVNIKRRILLVCGVLAPLLYVGSDIVAAILRGDYSFTAQAER